jgi:hypothetical protein
MQSSLTRHVIISQRFKNLQEQAQKKSGTETGFFEFNLHLCFVGNCLTQPAYK